MLPLLKPLRPDDQQLLIGADSCASAGFDWLQDRYADDRESLVADACLLFGQPTKLGPVPCGCSTLRYHEPRCTRCQGEGLYFPVWHLPQQTLALVAGLKGNVIENRVGGWGVHQSDIDRYNHVWRVEGIDLDGRLHHMHTGNKAAADREFRRRVLALFPEVVRVRQFAVSEEEVANTHQRTQLSLTDYIRRAAMSFGFADDIDYDIRHNLKERYWSVTQRIIAPNFVPRVDGEKPMAEYGPSSLRGAYGPFIAGRAIREQMVREYERHAPGF